MKLSWSHKLFLRINQSVGENRRRDAFMLFCGKWLIYFIAVFLFLWLAYTVQGDQILRYTLFVIIVIACSYGISLVIGVILRKPRPEIEIPATKQLIHTIGLQKSFPSDHTNVSFLMVFVAIILGLSIYLYIPLLICASLVAVGRVYCGVHYPRDILGGFFLALIVAFIFYIFMVY